MPIYLLLMKTRLITPCLSWIYLFTEKTIGLLQVFIENLHLVVYLLIYLVLLHYFISTV